MNIVRLDAASRRKMIVDSAIECARAKGVWHIDFGMVAAGCKVATSEATVRRYFHTAQELRHAVIETEPELAQDERGRE
jgi:AcrR family transcriptional regulator